MPQRNAPCPCGSGRRFKQCHGQLPGAVGDDADDRVDFVIAGARRAGTTSLDLRLREHPGFAMPWTRKELHYFDHDEHFGAEPWSFQAYHANFPPRTPGSLRGDTTPSYMYWTPAAERMARYNPELKIIVILRNPDHARVFALEQGVAARPRDAAVSRGPEGRVRTRRSLGAGAKTGERLVRRPRLLFPSAASLVAALRGRPGADPAQFGAAADATATLNRIANFLELQPFAPVAPKTANARQYENPIDPVPGSISRAPDAAEIQELERLLKWDCSDWRQMP